MKSFIHSSLTVFFTLCWAALSLGQQAFECDGKLYVATAGGGGQSNFIQITKDTSLQISPSVSTITANAGARITAMGFNVLDNFIYGLDHNDHSLLRIGADGKAVNLGVPANLNTNLEYLAGDVRPQGFGLFAIGRMPGGNDQALYTISFEPPYYAGFVSIVSDEPVRITDVAFDPVFGGMYGFDEIQKRLVRVSTGGSVTSVHYESQPQITPPGALFFDRWGNLYGLGGSSLYLFNKFNGKVLKTFQVSAESFSDGCSCPYRIDFLKKIEPSVVIPCTEVTVTYRFLNTAAISYGQNYIEDEFPPGFTITEIVRVPLNSDVVSGVGTNLLKVEGMDILLGPDSLVIKVNVGDFSGVYSGQAVAGPLPLALGTELFSDDPATPLPDDPTSLAVLHSGAVILQTAPKLCAGGTAILSAAANGLAYTWSDGSKGPYMQATKAGWYWVEVEGPCGIYRDSVLVVEAAPIYIDLGEDRITFFGEELTLDYATNAGGDSKFQWSATGANLSCTNCPHPKAQLFEPATFSVTVTSASGGCTAIDELSVGVEETRQVYVPNAFSPNGDGINDRFYLQTKGNFPIRALRVYDRWGGLLFEKKEGSVNDPESGWDGRKNGSKAGEGVYFWFTEIVFTNEVRKQFSGTISLFR